MSIKIGIKHKLWCENFSKLNLFMSKNIKRARANILMNKSHLHCENFYMTQLVNN